MCLRHNSNIEYLVEDQHGIFRENVIEIHILLIFRLFLKTFLLLRETRVWQ